MVTSTYKLKVKDLDSSAHPCPSAIHALFYYCLIVYQFINVRKSYQAKYGNNLKHIIDLI